MTHDSFTQPRVWFAGVAMFVLIVLAGCTNTLTDSELWNLNANAGAASLPSGVIYQGSDTDYHYLRITKAQAIRPTSDCRIAKTALIIDQPFQYTDDESHWIPLAVSRDPSGQLHGMPSSQIHWRSQPDTMPATAPFDPNAMHL